MKELLKIKSYYLRRYMKSNSLRSLKSGYSILMEETAFCPQEFSFMV